MHYLDLLALIHEHLRPRVYLEIGVERGSSLARAQADTKAIAIDPEPQEFVKPIACDYELFPMTSDDYFAANDPGRVDLAFIDGMHLFEYALRDFINLERHASLVLVHDCNPIDAVSASRERTTKVWTGDVWKLVPCLRSHRPDLHVAVADVAPTGLGIISGLDPASETLTERYPEIRKQYEPLDFTEERRPDLVEGTWRAVRPLFDERLTA